MKIVCAILLFAMALPGLEKLAARKSNSYVQAATKGVADGRLTPQEGANLYSRAIALNPANSYAHYQLAVMDEKLGRDNDAIDQYRTAMNLNPQFVEAYLSLARALIVYKSDFSGAITVQDVAASEVGKKLTGWPLAAYDRDYGWAMIRLGYSDQAVSYLKASLKITPKQVGSHCLLGQAFQAVGNPEAKTEFSECIKANDAEMKDPSGWADSPEPAWILEAEKNVSK